jgi:hypothetical protein
MKISCPKKFLLILIFGLAVTACAPVQEGVPGTPTGQDPLPTQPPEIEPPAVSGGPLSDEQIRAALFDLIDPISQKQEAARELVVAAGDTRFISVFIELIRAGQLGLVRGTSSQEQAAALEALSGQAFGGDWPAWVEWYGVTDLEPPPGFTGWKGQLLSRIDPGFGEFLSDEHPSLLRTEEVQWGGVLVDGIPALDNAAMIPAGEADYLMPGEPVFGIALNGDARAYPLRILDWHEMANDVVGGVPVSLAYCTLCGAGIAFDGRAPNGETYDFGSSGFLYRSNKLMYDRQTRTLWNQLTGEPVLGPLVREGEGPQLRLDLLPVVLTTWEAWQEQHPDTQVLDLETGFERVYLPGAAYASYFASEDTMFPVWQRDDLLPDKARVYTLRVDGVPKAYPLHQLTQEKVVNDTLGETPLVLVAGRGTVEVEGVSLRDGPAAYEAGGEVRAFDRGSETFSPGPGPDQVLDSAGGVWQVTEEGLLGPDGQIAPRVQGHLAYWFGWYAFFPQTLVYGVETN